MTEQREKSLRKAISYCIENFDVNKATSRLIQFIKDEEAINYTSCCTELPTKEAIDLELKEIAILDKLTGCPVNQKQAYNNGFMHGIEFSRTKGKSDM